MTSRADAACTKLLKKEQSAAEEEQAEAEVMEGWKGQAEVNGEQWWMCTSDILLQLALGSFLSVSESPLK